MLLRRLAVAIGLLCAGLASQLPEYTQQYRQRLGGAIDELKAIVAQFDQELSNLSRNRQQGIARLKGNGDPLVQARGTDIAATIDREARLERQQSAFATAGPLSQYAVLAEGFDPQIARRAYADFEPAVPVTPSGLFAGFFGMVLGWLATHGLALPFRRRQRPEMTASAHTRSA